MRTRGPTGASHIKKNRKHYEVEAFCIEHRKIMLSDLKHIKTRQQKAMKA